MVDTPNSQQPAKPWQAKPLGEARTSDHVAFIVEGFGMEDGRARVSRPTRSIDNHATMEEASS
jgi:hypothetical protein